MSRPCSVIVSAILGVLLLGCDSNSGGDEAANSSEHGELHLEVVSGPALVYLDDALVGISDPASPFVVSGAPGLHDLVIRRVGFHDHVSRLRFEAAEDRFATVRLLPQRLHRTQTQDRHRLPLGSVVRGAITSMDLPTEATWVLGVKRPEAPPAYSTADVIELLAPGGQPVQLMVSSAGTQLHLRLVDDQGKLVGESLGKLWVHKISFTAEEKRSYFLILEPRIINKLVHLDMVRYAVALEEPSPVEEK